MHQPSILSLLLVLLATPSILAASAVENAFASQAPPPTVALTSLSPVPTLNPAFFNSSSSSSSLTFVAAIRNGTSTSTSDTSSTSNTAAGSPLTTVVLLTTSVAGGVPTVVTSVKTATGVVASATATPGSLGTQSGEGGRARRVEASLLGLVVLGGAMALL